MIKSPGEGRVLLFSLATYNIIIFNYCQKKESNSTQSLSVKIKSDLNLSIIIFDL